MISRTSRAASSSVGDSKSSRVASPRQAGPLSALALPEATSSSRASGPPFSIDGIHRWWAMGWALTNPAVGDSSRRVTTAWASRRPPAARAPERVRPGLVDRAQLLGVALDEAAREGDVRVDPDVDAPRVDPPAVTAPHHGQALGILGADGVEEFLPAVAARLPVGPDQRHRARVLRGGSKRAGQQVGDARRVGPVLDREHVTGVVPRRGGQQRRPPGGGPGIEEAGHVGHARSRGSSVSVPGRSGVFPAGSYLEAPPGGSYLDGCPGPVPAVTLLDHLYPNVLVGASGAEPA